MGTVDSREIIKEILEGDGVYPGDPQCYGVYAYHNLYWGHWPFSIEHSREEAQSLLASPAVGTIIPLWTTGRGVTDAGKKLLEDINYDYSKYLTVKGG